MTVTNTLESRFAHEREVLQTLAVDDRRPDYETAITRARKLSARGLPPLGRHARFGIVLASSESPTSWTRTDAERSYADRVTGP